MADWGHVLRRAAQIQDSGSLLPEISVPREQYRGEAKVAKCLIRMIKAPTKVFGRRSCTSHVPRAQGVHIKQLQAPLRMLCGLLFGLPRSQGVRAQQQVAKVGNVEAVLVFAAPSPYESDIDLDISTI